MFTLSDRSAGSLAISEIHFRVGSKGSSLYLVPNYSLQTNKGSQHLNLLDIESKAVHALTAPGVDTSDSTPVWLDNATVAFLSARPESDSKDAKKALTQIWSVPIDGALAGGGQLTKPKQLSNYTLPVNNFVYNIPSGHLLLDFSVYPNTTLTETVARDAVQKARLDSAQIYDNLPFRIWDTWVGPKSSSLFLTKLSKHQERILDGEPVLLVSADSDGPVQPAEYRFSPDGKEIAFSYLKIDNVNVWKKHSWIAIVQNLSSLPCFGRRHCNNIDIIHSKTNDAGLATYSPDGRYIAWIYDEFINKESTPIRVNIYDRVTREDKEIAKGWDHIPGSLVWTKDSSGLIAVAEDKGHVRAFYIPLEFESVSTSTPATFDLDGDDASAVTLTAEPVDAAFSSSVVPLTPNGAVVAVEALDANRFLVQHQSSVSPGDLWADRVMGFEKEDLCIIYAEQRTSFDEAAMSICGYLTINSYLNTQVCQMKVVAFALLAAAVASATIIEIPRSSRSHLEGVFYSALWDCMNAPVFGDCAADTMKMRADRKTPGVWEAAHFVASKIKGKQKGDQLTCTADVKCSGIKEKVGADEVWLPPNVMWVVRVNEAPKDVPIVFFDEKITGYEGYFRINLG
ncbi:hypothetical protein GQ42DRAFT_170581 [Ramicandelaber brevisporus]|nr:hypothetical protein GQ42DRAFT_170581 [Ramicandelaber brevisporus]